MTHAENPEVRMPRERTLLPTVVGVLAAVMVFAFVLTSSLIATLHEFRFESQLPALMPFFVWGAATGAGHLANLGRALFASWRAALGIWSLVPYAALMLATAVVPGLAVPWWAALVVAALAALPFLVVGLRADPNLRTSPAVGVDDDSRRGTFLVGAALMVTAYATVGPVITASIVSVLAAVALGVASLMTHGLARASRTWRMRHWATLTWGSLVIWAGVIVKGTTHLFDPGWAQLVAVVLAGVPLVVVNMVEGRRA